MKVSIIIPVYNVEKYLEECLDSAVGQTLKEVEIICINDGSTDSSEEILNNYKKNYSNIKIINQENKGLSSARNSGLKIAKGEYIYFLDSDDYIDLKAMEICYEEAKTNKLDILTFDAECFVDDGYSANVVAENYDRSNILGSKVMDGEEFYIYSNEKGGYRAPVWLNLYRRKYIENNKLYFYDGILHEDEIHTIESYIKANRIKYINNKLFRRRIRSNSIMTSPISEKRIYSNKVIAEETYKFYCHYKLKQITKEILIRWITLYYSNSIRFCDSLGLRCKRDEIVKEIKEKNEIKDINLEIQINNPELYYDLHYLKSNRKNELYLYKNMKKIIYMSIPTHGNLGDHAIVYSSIQMLKEKYPHHKIIKINYEDTYLYIDVIKDIIGIDDFVVLPGGGNMGNHYIWEEQARRHIISNLINIPIISFPQTIYFSDDEEGRKEFNLTKKIYNSHSNLILLAREETSFNIMKKNFPNCKVELCPDIVFYLNNKLDIEKECLDRKYITVFFRKDKESYYSINDKHKLIQGIKNTFDVFESDTVVNYKVNGITRQNELFKLWRKFYKSKVVITDRLHGMIFAAITKTPCIVLRSLDYKVIKSYEWISSLNYIKMTDNISLDNIKNLITELEAIEKKDDFCFDDKYLMILKNVLNKNLEVELV